MKKITINITNCGNRDCGGYFPEMPYWGSKEGIAAGENKRVRVIPVTVGKIELKKAA